MVMQKLFVIVLATFVIVVAASAQITIVAANVDEPGVAFQEVYADDVTVNPGPAGANQTWTIPAYTWADTSYAEYVNPANTAFAAYFPTATRAEHRMEATDGGPPIHIYAFDRIAPDGWYLLGIGMQMDTIVYPVPFVPEVRQAPLPVSFGASWTTVLRTDLGGGDTSIDSSLITVDGWGTLNTPFGSSSALRVFVHVYEITRGPGGETVEEDASYAWLDEHGMVVADLESAEETGNPNFTTGQVTVRHRVTSGVDPEVRGPVAERLSVGQNYPNPFNPTTVLPVELSQTARVTLDIYDSTGRLVASREMELPAGRHTLPVDGSQWAAGTYFARVQAGGAQQITKMQLVK